MKLEQHAHPLAQQVRARGLLAAARESLGDFGVHVVEVPRQHAFEEGFLGGEVIQETALADACGLCHGIERQVRGARLGNHSLGRIEQPLACRAQRNRLAEIHIQ